jgi:hypothetical protein
MLSTKLKEAAGNSADATLYVNDVFSTYLYAGTGSTQTITNGIDLAGQGGMVWIKNRTGATDHGLFDTVRGAGYRLISNTTDAQNFSLNYVSSFNSNGFSLGAPSVSTNWSGDNYASWTFRKAAKFFDVVTFNKNSSTNQRISHSLGQTPGMIIVKSTSRADGWYVYHRSFSDSRGAIYQLMTLDSTGAITTSSANPYWGTSAPTDTDFGVSIELLYDGGSPTYVAYLFAHDTSSTGIIQCGSFTTNGSGNATVNLGWEPQYVMVKRTDGISNWRMVDSMRGWPVAADLKLLYADSSLAENTDSPFVSLTATGFVTLAGNIPNSSTWAYMAIRRPNKPPTTGTQVFSVESYSQTSASDPAFNLGKVADMGFRRVRDFDNNWTLQSRLTGNGGLVTNTSDAESTANYGNWDNMVGWYQGAAVTPPYSQANWYGWTFARAPGFFDVVCYTGNGSGSGQIINHNLGVTPELIIIKSRSGAYQWHVYVASLGQSTALFLEDTSAAQANGAFTGGTINSTQFQLKVDYLNVNGSGVTYVSYLFATLAGISKVGSYTGNGSSQNIDCGFAAGARFFLVKATSTTGSWWVWDSARGIVAGNDPALQLNSTAAEITTADAVDPYAAGITVNQEATCSINASGVSYIYLAIS